MIQQTPDRGVVLFLTRAGVPWFLLIGTGTPEGIETAPPGSLYSQTDGVHLWKKFTGTGSSGWKKITFSGLTPLRPLKLDADGNPTSGQIDPTSSDDVEVASLTDGALVKRSGSALASVSDGVTTAMTVVTNVSTVGFTLNYKDHGSNNQTKNLIESVGASTTLMTFLNGRYMS